MKKLEFDQILSLLANFAVVAGILLLVLQLSQNREIVIAQTRAAVSQSFIDVAALWASENNAALVERGNRGDELSSDEYLKYTLLLAAVFRGNENAYYQYRQGLYDRDEFFAQREAWWRLLMNNKGVVDFWCLVRSSYSPEFVADTDQLLTQGGCAN